MSAMEEPIPPVEKPRSPPYPSVTPTATQGPFPNLGEMLVRGQRARIIGRVCMDQLMLDVTHIPDVEEGDVVTVFGRDGGAFLPVEEVSSLDQTINYETVCQITKRVPRIYRGGKLGGLEKAGRPAR